MDNWAVISLMLSGFNVKKLGGLILLGAACARLDAAVQIPVVTQTNVNLRVVAANLTSGNSQRYETAGLNILKGLKPDVVAIQEFNVSNNFGINTPAAIRSMVDNTFGTNFVYFRESDAAYNIPNGVISRYPFSATGQWEDSDAGVNDRGFAWASVDLPGTNDLYVVSVHLKASSGSDNPARRAAQAAELKDLISTNFPANAWIIVAGDFNLYAETETAIETLKTFLSDSPVPTDLNGDPDTNRGRTERYDRVLPSFSLTNALTPVILPSHTFSNGLVFVSTNYVPLSDVTPVQYADSTAANMQHMGVAKDFRIPFSITNFINVDAPVLSFAPPGVLRWQGASNLTYTVWASSNLTSWENAGSSTSTNAAFSFTNTINPGRQIFYRVTYP